MSATVFEILSLKARIWLIFQTPPLFDAPLGNPLEFLDETYSVKTREMELPCSESSMILSFSTDPPV